MQLPPAVNIVLSYDPEAMISFRKQGSFEAFVEFQRKRNEAKKLEEGENYVPNTYIFNNSPNSTFLSLEHQFGGADGESRLEVEIIDPQGVFESSMLDNTLYSQLDINMDPVAQRLKVLEGEILNEKSTKHTLLDEARKLRHDKSNAALNRLREIDAHLAVIRDKVDALEENLDDLDTNVAQNQAANRAVQKQMDSQLSQLQRPVFVTYGIGDDFKNWAPVQCFGQVLKIEYSFNGTGARTLKIKFNGKSLHPNLMRGFGVNPLGSTYTQGLLAKGLSYQIFNTEAAKSEVTKFLDIHGTNLINPWTGSVFWTIERAIVEKYLGKAFGPSFHLTVTEAIADMIKRASCKEQVVVLMPDLDYWLKGYLKDCIDDAYWRCGQSWNPFTSAEHDEGTGIAKLSDFIKGYGEALEGIGLKLCDVPTQGAAGAVGRNTYEYIEECDSLEDAQNWLEGRTYKVVAEVDFAYETFLEKLEKIGEAIQGKIEDYNKKPLPIQFMNEISVETDFEMIRIMQKHGLVSETTTPVIYWGDRNIRDKILYARLLETTAKGILKEKDPKSKDAPDALTNAELFDFSKQKLEKYLHPLDMMRGLNLAYMKDVLDYQIPAEGWTGPFGPMYEGNSKTDLMLTNDTNLSNAAQPHSDANPLLGSRLPVFTFGSRNPNILGIDIDINGIFVAAMNSAGPIGKAGQANVAGIVPKDFEGTAERMFKKMEDLDLNNVDKNGVPKGFYKLMEPYYDYDWPSGDDIENFEEWSKVFKNMSDTKYSDIADQSFYSKGGNTSKQRFMKFMWKAFQALYAEVKPSPKMDRKGASKDPSIAEITRSTRVAQKINESALNGKITTVPLFSLSTDRRVMNRACLLHCIEPQFIQTPGQAGPIKANATWFSGIYNMHGFKHKINGNSVESQFFVSRPGKSGLSDPNEKEASE